jgi:ketosteroid isomerase-like protein
MSEEATIRQVILDRAQAIHKRNAETAVGYYASDIVNFDLAPPLAYRGQEATNPAELQSWFDSWTGPIELSFAELQIHSGGAVALAHGLMRMVGPRTDGTHTDVWARMTLGFEKRDGDWKIVHEHQSFPTMMDGSGLSASSLLP